VYISLEQSVEALGRGRLVALPTETVYGLGAIATDERAIQRVYDVKERPRDNPLICHFYDVDHILSYVSDVPDYWRLLVDALSPGPVSFRFHLPADSPLRPAVAGQTTVVCRIPDQPLCLEVIRQVGVPVAAPSANTSGKVSPTTAQMVALDLGSKIAGVLDGGPCETGLESTILDCTDPLRIVILRPGSIGREEILGVLLAGGFSDVEVSYAKGAQTAVVPGSKYRHYAPDTRLIRVANQGQFPDVSCAVLVSKEQADACEWPDHVKLVVLGSRCDLPEVARHLYQAIKSLDEFGIETAYYIEENWGDSSLGRAIANRLLRASVALEET
jgi:L-threonylcarbamoyladenylate synthase